MTKAHDLSNIKGSYTNALKANIDKIYNAYSEHAVNTAQLKQIVIDSISSTNDTEAKRRFLTSLNKQTNKDGIVFLVSNTYLRGSGLGANINDRFAK